MILTTFGLKGAWPVTRARQEDRFHEMVDQIRVKCCNNLNEIVKAMDIRNIIISPAQKNSTIVFSELAVVEITFIIVKISEDLAYS